MMPIKYAKYRHSDPNATLDVLVLNILHVYPDKYKLKVHYINKFTGRIQYTGVGRNGDTDTVCISKEDFKYFTIIRRG